MPTTLCGPTLRKCNSLGSMPTTLCGPTLRKFNSLWSMPTSLLSCVVKPFENAIVFDQCQLLCVLWPFENAIVFDQCQLIFVVRPFENAIVTAKICSHRRVRVEISTRMRRFFLCWKCVIFHAKFMSGVSPYPTQPLFALPLHHWVPLQTLPTVGRLLPLQSVPKTILNFPKPCFQIVL